MTQTPIQHATALVIGAYLAACRLLTADEREALRDIIAAQLAHDYLAAIGELPEERAA
jgi:hypothetical protein